MVAAIIEASHDENGIIWPESVAPFQVAVINLKPGNEECDKIAEDIYKKYQDEGVEVLLDDTKNPIGQKFSIMDLIGVPKQIVVGPRLIKEGKVEIKDRKTLKKEEVEFNYDEIISQTTRNSTLMLSSSISIPEHMRCRTIYSMSFAVPLSTGPSNDGHCH